MKNAPSPLFLLHTFASLPFLLSLPLISDALGAGSTLAVTSSGSPTVCGVVSDRATQSLICYQASGGGGEIQGRIVTLQPNISFSSISGGQVFICGVRSGGYALLCWNTFSPNNNSAIFNPKRVYFNESAPLQSVSVGDDQICSTTAADGNSSSDSGRGLVRCWRGDEGVRPQLPDSGNRFVAISSGYGFSCGIVVNGSRIRCWGSYPIARQIELEFGNMMMLSVQAGGSHVCGVNSTGFLVCRGDNSSGQLNVPLNSTPSEYSQLALGANHSCALRRSNGSVACWGGGLDGSEIQGIFFESIISGSDFLCGIISNNLSTICWGPGWPGGSNSELQMIPLPPILPGPCIDSSSCGDCGVYGDSQNWCGGGTDVGVCRPCGFNISTPSPPPPLPPSPSPSSSASPRPPSTRALRKGLLAFAIIGSAGALSGISTVIYCVWTGACLGRKKIHNSVQPTITRAGSNGGGTNSNNNSGFIMTSRSSTIRRQSSKAMRRQRSGTSSKADRAAEEFSFTELAAATDGFSPDNKIGAGSYGVVYRGKLSDGREVAIKRGETSKKAKKYQEKESAFESELSFLSRLHHKHLVRLVGYCEDGEDEKLLVYEYMKNGALYDHLHNNLDEKSSGGVVMNSWKMRIKVALDAARGIDYLHNYAVPPIIHRDIKSSNILLDGNWVARVSDFGLSLLGPDPDRKFRPTKAAGTVGYIDPEYYSLNVLTAKSDVYGLGVVLLELLTGKRAIFKGEDGTPTSIVDYAVAKIAGGELLGILDPRVGQPDVNESEAVELVGYTAMHCVSVEGKDRPTMGDTVVNLERALLLCDGSHGSISSGSISILSQ